MRGCQLQLFGSPSPACEAVAAARCPSELEALGRRLPAGIRLGTSSWSFPRWVGVSFRARCTESRLAREGSAPLSAFALAQEIAARLAP